MPPRGSVALFLAAVAIALQRTDKLLLAHVHVLRIGQQGEGFGFFLGFGALVDALQAGDDAFTQPFGVHGVLGETAAMLASKASVGSDATPL